MKKIAIMTAGGDCAGLNAAIKAVVMAANKKNMVVVGIIDGFIGFVERKYVVLDNKSVENIERQLKLLKYLIPELIRRRELDSKYRKYPGEVAKTLENLTFHYFDI